MGLISGVSLIYQAKTNSKAWFDDQGCKEPGSDFAFTLLKSNIDARVYDLNLFFGQRMIAEARFEI